MIDLLKKIDTAVLIIINDSNTPFIDQVMWYISHPLFGLPMYIIISILLIKKHPIKNALLFILFIGICAALADLSAKHLFKEVFQRYRPSHNTRLQDSLHYVNNYRGGLYGFVSSHAANMFAIATSTWFIFKPGIKPSLILFLWASLIGYSRIYLGVHYPSDVLAGAVLGATIAIVAYGIFKIKVIPLTRSTLH